MAYCLDANVFIESHRRYYSFDIAPPFWSALADWGNQQTISAPRSVFDDLNNGGKDDSLFRWAKEEAQEIFHDNNPETYRIYGQIADLVSDKYEPHQVQEFLDCSDPWVIAFAKANNLVVVTMEIFRQEVIDNKTGKIGGKKIQIPNICKKIGVSYIDTFRLLQEMKFVFH